MSLLNLIFDGNYLFHKTRFVTMQYAKKSSKKYLEKKEEQEIFIRKVATDFVSVINNFSNTSNIIFTKDSSTWRKELYPFYKANRIKSDDDIMNWDIFYKLIDEFLEILKENNVIVSTIKNAEADDLMYLWANYINENNLGSSIIVTGDADLTQTTFFNNNGYNIIYNNHSKSQKLITPIGFNAWINTKLNNKINSIFEISQSSQVLGTDISSIKNVFDKIEIEEIDPNIVVLSKILCGDKSDNVPSLWNWINKNGNIQKITNKYVQPVYDYLMRKYNRIDVFELLENKIIRNNIRKELEDISKTIIDSRVFEEKLKQNIELVYLNNRIIPAKIIEEFEEKNNILDTNKTNSFNRIELLQGTRFEKNIEIISDVFDI